MEYVDITSELDKYLNKILKEGGSYEIRGNDIFIQQNAPLKYIKIEFKADKTVTFDEIMEIKETLIELGK